MQSVNYKKGESITLLCLIGNIILSILKLVAGILGNSKAMVADALHSTSDVIATVVVYIGIRIAKKPRDKGHPYGHGKVEPLASLFVAFLLIIAAFAVIQRIVQCVLVHSFITPSYMALAAAVFSIVVKEFMFRITYAEGKKINSESIMANAWDHRSDAYSSIGTFFGIGASILGQRIDIHWLEYMDPLAGAIVACMILKVAYDILRQSVKGLMDASPEAEVLEQIEETVLQIREVLDIPWVKARYIGQYLFIDLALEVDYSMTVHEGHEIAVKAEKAIKRNIPHAFEIIVHIEPGEIE
jgi:cation diffusion facilitator family transporter